MKPVLIHIRPLDTKSDARLDVRAGDGASAEVFGAAGLVWEPIIVARPQLSIELFTTQMDGKMQAGRAQFTLALGALTSHPRPAELYWKGAEVFIWDTDTPLTSKPAFRGHVTAATPDRETGRLAVTAEVSGAVLIDKPLLTLTFGGGGGADGDGGKRGVFKPAGFGIVKNIEPVWFDQTRNIGMIDGYANTVSIGWLGEGRSSFGASVGDYPNYAALAAAIDAKAIPPGRWATCIAEGMVGLGAPPNGVITVDAVFGVNRVGAFISRILSTHAALGVDRIDVGAFLALDAAVPRPIHYWTADQRNIRDLVEAIARSANASPILTFGGKISITRVIGGAPVLELDLTGGTTPRVLNVRNAAVDAPAYRLAARAARPARVLSYDEINYEDSFDDTNGLYKATETYRAGDLVWTQNGAKFLYINGTPAAGQALPTATYPPAPPAANAYWQQLLPPTTANWSAIVDDNGNKPADNADVTGENIAGGIKDQGPGATAPGSEVLNYIEEPGVTTIVQPGGGFLSTNGTGGLATGALKIRLPLGASDTMLRFQLDVFDYVAGGSQTYFIQGYSYASGGGSLWYQEDARLIGGSGSARPVRFGHDGARMCIWVGDPGTEWWYPKFAIRGVQVSFANFSAAQWKSGWTLSLDTAAATNVTREVLKPVAGDSSFGENLRETFGGALATIPNFKTILGIAGGILNQGTGATANSLAQLNAADAAALAGVVSAVGSITSDSVIATSEKMGLIQAWKQTNALWLEQNAISLSLNGTYGGDPTGVYRGNASAAVSALINYLESLSPGWADPTVNTPVDGGILRNLFTAATNTISALGEANGYQLSTRSTWGSVGGRPIELTDGRVGTALDSMGVLHTGLFGGNDSVSVADIISASAMSGTQLAINPEFALPLVPGNGVFLYDNSGGGKVGLTRISGAAAPNSSKMMLVINYDGTGVEGHSVIGPSPGFGGFTLQLVPAAVGEVSRPGFYARNSLILFKIVADIPVGRALAWESNATGDGSSIKYLTTMNGEGAFKEYLFAFKVGATGTFSSTGYFYVYGGPNAAFSWSVAKADAIDLTGAPRVTFGQGVRDENGVARGGTDLITPLGIAAGFADQGWGATADQKLLDNNFIQTVRIIPWGASVSGNTITRASGDTDYNAAAYADRINGPCYVSLFIASDVWNMVSLDGDLADRAYSAMSATVHYHPTSNGGTCELYVFGALISNLTGVGNWSGTELQLVYDGSFFRVMLGGDNPTSHAAPANLALYPVWHAYNAGVRFYNLRSGPAKSAARIGSNTFDGFGNLKGGPDIITIEGVAGALYNQGPGATALAADVLNYHEAGGITTIRRPGGGTYAFNGGAIYGAIKIALPVANSHTMIRFFVDIFDYQIGGMVTYAVSGCPYSDSGTPTWVNVSAQVNGSSTFSRPVKFGWDGAKTCIWIGETTSYWSYPQVAIRDFQAGYNAQAAASWNSGWVVSMDAAPPALVARIIQRPVAGDAIMGENVLEAPGTPATNANYKTNLGISAAVENQGRGATSNTLTDLNPTEGAKLAGIEGSADVTSSVAGVAEVVISADHTGTPLTGQLPKGVAFRLIRQGADITAGATWSRTVVSGTITCTIGSGNGALNITAISTDAVVRVVAVYGSTTRVLDVKVSRSLANPPSTGSGGGGTAASTSDFYSISSTSMVAITAELTVTVGSAGNVDVAASTNYDFTPGFGNSYMDVFIVWQRWNGSAWVDLHGEVGGVPAYREGGGLPSPSDSAGYVSMSMTVSSLTPGSSQKFRLRARGSSTDSTWFFNSSASAQG